MRDVKKFRDFVKFAISHDQDIKSESLVLRLGRDRRRVGRESNNMRMNLRRE